MVELRVIDGAREPNKMVPYLEGQRRTYEAFGVGSAVTPQRVAECPVFAIAAYGHKDEILGGARLSIRTLHTRLPVEVAIGDATLNTFIVKNLSARPAEVGGLWLNRNLSRSGLSAFLLLGIFALCRSMNMGFACFCADATRTTLYQGYGAVLDPSRAYAYPDDRYTTHVGYIDLEWPEQPLHPAREWYRTMISAFRGNRSVVVSPKDSLAWSPPPASYVPWAEDGHASKRPHAA